jgi:hypothetical protein
MEHKKPPNSSEDPHKKAQDAIDHARNIREERLTHTGDKSHRSPHLIAEGSLKRCSVCGYAFPADVHPSMTVAFSEHLLKVHTPGNV